MRIRFVSLTLLFTLTLSCTGSSHSGTDGSAADASVEHDGSISMDAGTHDAAQTVDDGARVDAPPAPDASASGDGGGSLDAGGACGFFDTLVHTCTASDMMCAVAVHQMDCCGTYVATGISMSEKARFDMLEPACEASYPACGCAARPTMTDSGEVVTDPTTVHVGCIARGPAGVCMTYVTMRPPDGR